jgi:uncharacterized protein
MDDMSTVLDQGAVQTRAEVLVRLRQHEETIRALGAIAVFMFGSAARDQLKSNSDIDLFFDYPRGQGFDYYALCDLERLASQILGRRVDLMSRDGLHPHLRPDIEATAVKVF